MSKRAAAARRARRAVGVLVATLTLSLVGGLFLPMAVDRPHTRDSAWDQLVSWFIGQAMADPKPVPQQPGGAADGPRDQVPANQTRASTAKGRSAGRGSGELDGYDSPDVESHSVEAGRKVSPSAPTVFDPATSTRLAKESDATTDVYANVDGSETAVMHQGKSNYQDDNGEWQPIDTDLVTGADGDLEPKQHDLDISIDRHADDDSLVSVGVDDTHSVAFGLDGAAAVTATVDGDQAVFSDVTAGVDLIEQPLTNGVKETLVVDSADAGDSWSFPLILKGLTARKSGSGSVELVDSSKKVKAFVPAGSAQDSSTTADGPAQTSVKYDLSTSDTGQTVLTVSVDPGWLSAPGRAFPVMVDPTIATLSSYGYYETSPLAAHPDQLRMGTATEGGTNRTARSYLAFSGFDSQFAGQKVTAASLDLFDEWSKVCSSTTTFDVRKVTSAWTGSALASPGPTLDPAPMGTWSGKAPSASCTNTGYDTSKGGVVTTPLNADGLALLNGWINQPSTNFGLGLTASETDANQWKIFDSGAVATHQPALSVTYTPNVAPQIDSQYPLNNYTAQTLTPELLALGHDADAYPNPAVTYSYTVYNLDDSTVASSGATPDTHWTVPAGKLTWGTAYKWAVTTSDGSLTSLNPQKYVLNIAVPQPALTSELSEDTDDRGFEPNAGNYTNDDTDADVETVGPDLSVARSYNSNDPRSTGGFGAGWSTVYDAHAAVRRDTDGTETGVVLTYPDGSEVGFGKNPDGTYSPAPGRYTQFSSLGSGQGYKLVDKSATTYSFGTGLGTDTFGLDAITDASGRKETFTYDTAKHLTKATSASGRSLTLDWSTPAGAANPHVTKVSTDPLGGAPLVWTYGYSGDKLASVCDPRSTTKCTTYGYTNSNLYPQSVLDLNPSSYWRLGEPAGSKRAKSAVLLNAGTDDATYSNVTLGAAPSLGGSTSTSVTFDGTKSSVRLLNRLALGGTFQTLTMRFKAAAPDGVLFSYSHDAITAANATRDFTPSLYVGSDGKLMGEFWNGHAIYAMSSPASVVDSKWHDVALVATGTSQAMYLDGVKVATLDGQVHLATANSSGNVYLGAGFIGGVWRNIKTHGVLPSPPLFFKGSMSDVAFFDRSLTDAELAGLRSQTAATPQLSTITRPSGSTYASVSYDTAAGRASKVVDQNGGTWGLSPLQVSGSSQVFASSVLGAGPADYWRMDDASGPDVDNEVHGDLLTHVGGVKAAQAGRFADAKSATYDGTTGYSDFVADPDNPTATVIGTGGNQSIGLWFKTSTASGVLAGYNTTALSAKTTTDPFVPLLYVGTDGKLRGQYADGTTAPITTSGSVTDGKWHHAVLAAGASAQTLYLDGTSVGTKSGTVALPAATANTHTQIGGGFLSSAWPASGKTTATSSYFKGSISDAATYNVELSADQVTTQWAAAAQSDGKAAVTTAKLVDPGQKTLSYTYDPYMGSRTLAEVDALGNQTQYGYDTSGYLYTVTDPNGDVTTTGHDIRGNDVSTKTCQDFSADKCSTVYYTYFPDNTTLNPAPDPRNDVITSMRDGRSSSATDDTYKTTFNYDSVGNQTAETTPPVPGYTSGRTTTTTYTTASTTASGGGTTPAGLVAKVTTPAGRATTFSYTSAGDLAQQTDPSGLITRYTHDALGQVTAKTEVSDTFPAGVTTRYEYDGAGQVTKETEPGVKNVVTGVTHTAVTSTAFDENGNVTSQTVSDATGADPARTTSSTYDAHDQLSSTTDELGHTTTSTWDVYGNRISSTDATDAGTGTRTDYAYDAEGRLLTTTLKGYTGDPNAPSPAKDLILSSRNYDPAGRLASIQDSKGRTTAYAYTDDGLVSTITRAGDGKTFVAERDSYDAAGNVISQTTNNGFTTTTTAVDAAGRASSETLDPNGLNRKTAYTYDGDDLVTSSVISDAKGSQTLTAEYDGNGEQTKEVASGSSAPTKTRTTTWKRDQRGLVTSTTDPTNATTDYINDEAGQTTTVTSAQVSTESNGSTPVLLRPTSTMGYDSFGDQTHVRDANGNVQITAYDLSGRPISETAPSYTAPGSTTPITAVTTTEYDALDQVTASVDARGKRTTFTYDQLGDVAKQVEPGGATTLSSYDTNGDQLSQTDPVGAVTSATYDFLGHVVTSTQQLKTPAIRNLTTTTEYGTHGWPTKTTSPAGVVTSQDYNAAGDTLSVTDGAANKTQYAYDYAGRTVQVTNADGTKSKTSYDDAGNTVSSSDLDSSGTVLRTSTAEYDDNGQVTKTTSPRGGTSVYTYDARGQVTSQTQKLDATSNVKTTFGYDAAGNQTRFTDGRGNPFLTTWNSWNLPEAQIEPATTAWPGINDRTFSVAYDANGQVASTRAPGSVIVTNTYDDLGRLTAQTGTGAEASSEARAFTYDAAGRMLSAAAGTAKNTFTYDEGDELLTADGAAGRTTLNWDNDGHLASRADAAGLSTYGYDNAGRLSTMKDAATGSTLTYAYRSMNLVTSITYDNADTRTYSYDTLHRVVSDKLRTSSGGGVASVAYTYDDDDDITTKTTTGTAGAGTNTYSYDLADRLISWDNGATKTDYGYDASGNRTTVGAKTYTYDARNELLGDGGRTYMYTPRGTQASVGSGAASTSLAYDAYGQLASQGGTSYRYDALNRLIGTNTPAGPATTLSYSGAENLLANDGTSTYTWDPSGSLIGVGSVIANAQTPLLAWTDQHDDVVGQFGANKAALTKSVAYDPWGQVTSGGALNGNLGYQSAWTDPTTGRVDMLSRWYDPAEGQFTSRDRVNLSAMPNPVSANKFAYVDDNPLGDTDPTGECGIFGHGCGFTARVSHAYHAVASHVSHSWSSTSHAVHRVVHKARAVAHHVYHAAKRVVKHVVSHARHVVHRVVRHVYDSYHRIRHAVSHAWHRVKQVASHVYHRVKHVVRHAVHHVSSAVHKTVRAVKSAAHKAGNAVKHKASQAKAGVKAAAKATGNFVSKHAATITSVVVSTVVFMGCEAAVTAVSGGTLALPGAMACGALAGAAGSMAGAAVKAAQEHRDLTAGELGTAALTGAASGVVGGAAGPLIGKAVGAVGAKLAGPVLKALGREAGAGDGLMSRVVDDGASFCKLTGHSFTGSTKVLRPNGSKTAIAKLKAGDKVRTYNPKTGKSHSRAVTAVWVNRDHDLLDLKIRTKGHTSTLHTTASHPFYSLTRKTWVRADNLSTADRLWSSGDAISVDALAADSGVEDRFDLTIDTDHDYYVGSADRYVLVHNCGGGPRWRVGDDYSQPTAAGRQPAWSTVRARFWKNEAAEPGAADQYNGAVNVARMKKGLAPQQFNQNRQVTESMELSHEPLPQRENGSVVTPRWPADHALFDMHRHLKG